MKTIICTSCGTGIKSVTQAKERCEDKPYTKGPHVLRSADMALLIENEKRPNGSTSKKGVHA